MKSLKTLPFLKGVLPAQPPEIEDHRVVELFRNRAELKKAYSGVQEEIHRLRDRLKQQEGATQRVQELLEQLEARLSKSDTAYPAVVFYHLRGLWQVGRALIEQLVGDLARQQEERERKAHFAESNRRQFERRQELESRLRGAEGEAASTRQHVADLAAKRAKLTRFWHYFKRREVERQLKVAKSAASLADDALAEARVAHEALAAESAAEFPGLSLESRRMINLAAIAYAEVLCLRLSRTQLVALAREAVARREVSQEYGKREECERLMLDISRAQAALEQRTNLNAELKARTDRLRDAARYRGPADTVPSAESIGFAEGDVLAHGALGASAARLPNVLGEDTWDLYKVLLR
jgi:hypothetical protein